MGNYLKRDIFGDEISRWQIEDNLIAEPKGISTVFLVDHVQPDVERSVEEGVSATLKTCSLI